MNFNFKKKHTIKIKIKKLKKNKKIMNFVSLLVKRSLGYSARWNEINGSNGLRQSYPYFNPIVTIRFDQL